MNPWVTLTATDLKSSMTSSEVERFGKTATDGTPDDRVTQILSDLVAEIRAFIASASANTLSADTTTIPPEFKARALAIARWRLLITLPGYTPGEARKTDYEKAVEFFDNVAKGKIRPVPADDAVANPVPLEIHHATPKINARKRRFSRDQQEGI
jgi:phage gp36-like protein